MLYQYTKKCELTTLTSAIRASTIVTALDYITGTDTDVSIYFKNTLSTADQATLDTIVANHVFVVLVDPNIVSVKEFALTPDNKLPKVAAYEPEGSAATVGTHDFTDKCSWYQGSIQVINQGLQVTVGSTYKYLDKTHWIDLQHGRCYDEASVLRDSNNLYVPLIYIDGVLQSSGYTIDYPAGTVTFGQAPTGVVTASFFYADKSWFIIKPKAGKILSIKAAEVQFTNDVQLAAAFIFEPWFNHPTFGLIPVPNSAIKYKNGRDFMTACNGGTGYIEPWAEVTKPTFVFPFHYARPKPLKASQGVELRVYVEDHSEVVGEFATATFYVTVENE